jgi:putative protease
MQIAAFETPAFIGHPIGTIRRAGPDWLELDSEQSFSTGDGLTYQHQRQVVGFQVDGVERIDHSIWRLRPNKPMTELPGLAPGLSVNRNRDHAWEKALSGNSSARHIAVTAQFTDTSDGFALCLTDGDGVTVCVDVPSDHLPAKHPDQAELRVKEQLDRFGDSEFVLQRAAIAWSQPWFVPPSTLNALRRAAVDRLRVARLEAHPRRQRRAPATAPIAYPQLALSYLGNVFNAAARRFYEKHGVRSIEPAYEAHGETGDVPVMITRHCLRFSFSLCPKQAKGVVGVQGQIRAAPMTLIEGKNTFRLEFDCKACEMHVIGRLRPSRTAMV